MTNVKCINKNCEKYFNLADIKGIATQLNYLNVLISCKLTLNALKSRTKKKEAGLNGHI